MIEILKKLKIAKVLNSYEKEILDNQVFLFLYT
jgi:hypothetical protein